MNGERQAVGERTFSAVSCVGGGAIVLVACDGRGRVRFGSNAGTGGERKSVSARRAVAVR